MTKQPFCYGRNKALAIATQPGQPPHDQSYSSHMDTEEASTLPVQLPHTYTTVVYLLQYSYSPLTTQAVATHSLELQLSHRQGSSTQPGQLPSMFWLQNKTGVDSTSKLQV